MEECRKGNHPLIEITSTNVGYGGWEVVRWCPVCGSVVVDVDVDGRTMAGRMMKMKAPVVALNLLAKSKKRIEALEEKK